MNHFRTMFSHRIFKKLMWIIALSSFVISFYSVDAAKKKAVVKVDSAKSTVGKQRAAIVKKKMIEKSITSFFPKLSLENIYAQSITRNGTTATTDRFTQSEAHMSVPEVKKLIAATYNIKPYQNLIDEMLFQEEKYKSNYYVFYHGMDNVWRVPQDLYTQLYAHFNDLTMQAMNDFVFLRFAGINGPSSIKNFLINILRSNGLINDHSMSSFLYSVNIALFGNVGTAPECTWQYFIKSRNHLTPDRQIYEDIMDNFGLPHTYISDLMALTALYETKEETIVQLFVPKEKVDNIGYLSWIRGIPAHQEIIEIINTEVKNKSFSKTQFALDYYTELFKIQQANNPFFKDLIEQIQNGYFSLRYFLDFYRNKPEQIKDINHFAARLIFTPQVLLNPTSGVKVFRYSTTKPAQLQKYHNILKMLIDKVLSDE